MSGPAIEGGVPLAGLTTLELGGAAEHFVRATDRAAIVDALRWARARALTVTPLGGGSNVVVSDRGVPGLVLALATRGVQVQREGETVLVSVEAGEPWDALVARTVDESWAGIECLSGIPGLTGATPIQNVGAYGQEVSQCIHSVELLDRESLELSTRDGAACGFGYRWSAFKTEPDRFLVLAVTFALRVGAPAVPRYGELSAALANQPGASLREIRAAVLELRRAKSMLLDPADPNRRSAGSFFLNPVLADEPLRWLTERALAAGVIARADELPGFAADGGRKIPAAWLIERAGFTKGQRSGAVGISSKHTLALVHHGGGTSAELVAFARQVQERVEQRFGVRLQPEPVFLGFDAPPLC